MMVIRTKHIKWKSLTNCNNKDLLWACSMQDLKVWLCSNRHGHILSLEIEIHAQMFSESEASLILRP